MKQVFYRLLSGCAMMFIIAGSNAAVAEPYLPRVSNQLPVAEEEFTGSFCLDSMETVPFADDLMPIPVVVEGCTVPEGTIYT